jgi:hypothetical protein
MPSASSEQSGSLILTERDPYRHVNPHPERPHDHGGESKERDGKFQDELNEHGARAREEPDNEENRQAYREEQDQE